LFCFTLHNKTKKDFNFAEDFSREKEFIFDEAFLSGKKDETVFQLN